MGLENTAAHLADHHVPHTIILEPELLTKTSTVPQISVDMIRDLYRDTRTKAASGRVVIITAADKMTESAQNAFLKLLEEPQASLHFILTTSRTDKLLPTVRSRSQHIHIPPLTPDQSVELLDELQVPEAKKRPLLFIAGGLPGELTKLASDEEYFQTVSAKMQVVKQLLAPGAYDRITATMKLSLTRGEYLELIEMMIRTLLMKPDEASVMKLSELEEAYRRIENGGSMKLQLARAVV